MFKSASLCRVLLTAIALAAMFAPATAGAAPPEQPKPGFLCHDKALTGTGPGFKDSREASQQAATDDWLAKAKAVYPDADLAKAKDVKWECVKQGLYSKCFVTAVPCHPKPE
ncbi:MAG: hypothetical protein ACXWVI_00300 [Methyloceanibacter sp.]